MSEAAPEAALAEDVEEPAAPEEGGGNFSRSYVEKLRRENARYRSQVRELEPAAAKAAELEAANATEMEKAIAAAKAQTEQEVTARYTRLLGEAEARAVAAELKFRDAGDAVRLLDLDDIETDKDGAVNRDAVMDALRTIAEAKPYLTDSADIPSPQDAGIGVTGAGAKDYGSFGVEDFDKELGFQ